MDPWCWSIIGGSKHINGMTNGHDQIGDIDRDGWMDDALAYRGFHVMNSQETCEILCFPRLPSASLHEHGRTSRDNYKQFIVATDYLFSQRGG